MWKVIKFFDATTRYEMYDYWFRAGTSLTADTVYNMCLTEKAHEFQKGDIKGIIDWCKKLNNEKATKKSYWD